MELRRRGPLGAIHPGQECGPCQLCGKTSPYYSHPATWDKAISAKLYSTEGGLVQGNSCVCRACEKYIKRNITSENYKPRQKTINHDLIKRV